MKYDFSKVDPKWLEEMVGNYSKFMDIGCYGGDCEGCPFDDYSTCINRTIQERYDIFKAELDRRREASFSFMEEVEVSDDKEKWYTKHFMGALKDTTNPVMVVDDGDDYTAGQNIARYKYIRKIQPKEKRVLTIQEIAEKFGIPVEDVRIGEQCGRKEEI